MALKACHFLPTLLSFWHPFSHINQPKAFVTNEGYVVVTTNICVNGMSR